MARISELLCNLYEIETKCNTKELLNARCMLVSLLRKRKTHVGSSHSKIPPFLVNNWSSLNVFHTVISMSSIPMGGYHSKPQIYLNKKDQSSCYSGFYCQKLPVKVLSLPSMASMQGSETLCSCQNESPWHLQCLSECQAPSLSLSTSPSLLDVQTVRGKQVLLCWMLSAGDWNICFRQVLQMLLFLWCY